MVSVAMSTDQESRGPPHRTRLPRWTWAMIRHGETSDQSRPARGSADSGTVKLAEPGALRMERKDRPETGSSASSRPPLNSDRITR